MPIAVWTIKGQELLCEQFAAFVASKLRLDAFEIADSAFTNGPLCYDVKVGLNGFSDQPGVLSNDQIDGQNLASAVL